MKGASAYSFCPFQFSQEYQKGYEAGVRQHQIELKYQSQLLKKEIRPQYCEVGMIHETDPEHIWYLDEPYKILISDVKIIPKENVVYDKKTRLHRVKQNGL